MKTINIAALGLCMALSAGFAACDDDAVRPALTAPTVATERTTFESLSFKWEPIEGATQYGCRLSNENGQSVGSIVTQATEAVFSGLEASTTYTLEVWAFAAMDGDYSTPPAVTLTATTAALTKLTTPTVGITSDNGKVTVSWNAVEGAEYYFYRIAGENDEDYGSGTLYTTSHNISGLPNGNYTYNLYAGTTQKGYESKSETMAVEFEIAVYELWRCEGRYSSFSLGSEWDATMVAYSDGSYSILSFYGKEGYNLDFTVNEDNADDKFSIINGSYYSPADGWSLWYVPTGLAYPENLVAYPWDNFSSMEGDSRSGEVNIGCYAAADMNDYQNYDWGYDTFIWGGDAPAYTIDDVIGDYDTIFTGFQNDSFTNYTDTELYYSDYTTEIWYEDDDTVGIDGFLWAGCPVTGKFDPESMTITIAPQLYGAAYSDGAYYRIASENDFNTPVTAEISTDGSITMPETGIWYVWPDGGSWCCYRGTAYLTKIAENALRAKRGAPAQKGYRKSVNNASGRPEKAGPQKGRR